MKRYQFTFLEADNPDFIEKGHIVFADSLQSAIDKFEKKHEMKAPAYLDFPSFEKYMEIHFKDPVGYVKYIVSW